MKNNEFFNKVDKEKYVSDDLRIALHAWKIGIEANTDFPVLIDHLFHDEILAFLEIIQEAGFKKFGFSDFSPLTIMSIIDIIKNNWHTTGLFEFSFHDGDDYITRECVVFESRDYA